MPADDHEPFDLIKTLRKFDTPTVCNVIELFGVRSQTDGYMDRRIKANFPHLPPMVGYASTATFRATPAPLKPDAYRMQGRQLAALADTPAPPVIVFQDLDDPPRGATFGELMCLAYQRFGAVGLITSGAGRDIHQVGATDFPVFTDGNICSHGYPQIVDINVPVSVGGITVAPGDLIHGDVNGVTTIPAEIAEPVARLCAGFFDAEALMIDYLRDTDRPTVDGYYATLDRLIERIQALRTQAREAVTR